MSYWQSPASQAITLRQLGWRFFPKTRAYDRFWLHYKGIRARTMEQAFLLTPRAKESP